MVGMVNHDQQLPLPNPADWTDAPGAAAILGRSRATVYDMVSRGLLTTHRIGGRSMFWVAEVRGIREALDRLTTVQAARRESVRD